MEERFEAATPRPAVNASIRRMPFGKQVASSQVCAGSASVNETRGFGRAAPRLRRGCGIDGAVPARVTEMPATAQPKRTASAGLAPRASAAAKPPLKASPAPVVSTTGPALNAGIEHRCGRCVEERAGLAERDQRRADALLQEDVAGLARVVDGLDRDAGQKRRLVLVRRDVVAERIDRIVDRHRRRRD